MNAQRFRRLALALQGAVEGAHMGHPDFRRDGKIFASLHHDLGSGMVKLSPEEQRTFLREHPDAFAPENGAWGRQGCTRVALAAADDETVGEALTLAWQNAAGKKRTPSRPKGRQRPAGSR